jgi:2-oxoglutarate ferredoxin oxidoreductase subunit alpha
MLKPDNLLEEHNMALQKKYDRIEAEEKKWELYEGDNADYLLVAFGTAARVCRSAIQGLKAEGKRVGLFRPITLWPFPSQELVRAAERVKRILVVEMNLGQMIEDVRLAVNGSVGVDFYGRTAGGIPDPEEIVKRVNNYGKGA